MEKLSTNIGCILMLNLTRNLLSHLPYRVIKEKFTSVFHDNVSVQFCSGLA